MQAVTQVNARRGPETIDEEADLSDIRGRPVWQGKESDNRTLPFLRGRDDGTHRRNAHEAREADADSGGNRNGQPARARPGRVGGGEARRSEEAG
jgi:hypothetical protein